MLLRCREEALSLKRIRRRIIAVSVWWKKGSILRESSTAASSDDVHRAISSRQKEAT